MNILWYEKYKPKTLDEYVWKNENLKKEIKKYIETNSLPHLIFAGPPGTGKTSLAEVIIAELAVEDIDFLRMNASTQNGVGDVRNEIVSFCETGGWSGIKVILLDEAERLTPDAQDSLRGVMNDFNASVRFIFTCNDISKIRNPLKSRTTVITIDSLDTDMYLEKLINVCISENISLETDEDQVALSRIVELCYPDLRKGIGTLQSWTYDNKIVEPSQNTVISNEWESTLISYILDDVDISLVRDLVSNFTKEDIEAAYLFLCKNSHELSTSVEKDIVIIISDHVFRHNLVSHPDINLLSCIIKLMKVVKTDDNTG